jgi:hypothetical protein
MFEELIHLIEQHPTYSSAMRNAIARNLPLVLNYHTHQGEGTYCVSICTKMGFPVPFFEEGDDNLEELVHVRGFGRDRDQCLQLLTGLSTELRKHFKLTENPEFYLDGKPFSDV